MVTQTVLVLCAVLAAPGQGLDQGATVPDAARPFWTGSDASILREVDLMKARMNLRDVAFLVSPTFPESKPVPGQGVVVGQNVVDAFQAQQNEHPSNPDILGFGLGWVISHEYGHFYEFSYRMGLKAPFDGWLKRFQEKPVYWEAMADVLASYYCGGRMSEILAEEGRRRPIPASVVEARKATARRAITELGFKYGLLGTVDGGTGPTAKQRQHAADEGFAKGFEKAFGMELGVFGEGNTTERAKKAQQWLVQTTEAALAK